jgi:plastocyanin
MPGVQSAAITRARTLVPAAVSASLLLAGCALFGGGPDPVTIEVAMMDYSFRPSAVRVQPGQEVTLAVENLGEETHNLSSPDHGIDVDIPSGDVLEVEFTASSDETHQQFFCKYHLDEHEMNLNVNIPSLDTPGPGPPAGRGGEED